jgi:hypothetical protein
MEKISRFYQVFALSKKLENTGLALNDREAGSWES